MHATIQQLLNLRDGEPVDASIVRHADECTQCAAELTRLQQVRLQLAAMPALEPPAHAWDEICSRLQPQETGQRWQMPWAVAAAALIAVVCGLIVRELSLRPDTMETAANPSLQAVPTATHVSLDELVAQSRELDHMLQFLPQRPAVERVALAATIDTIEQRVQWLDQQLSYAPDTGLNDAQAYQLWRERVDLMDSLVKVRYAEGAPLSF